MDANSYGGDFDFPASATLPVNQDADERYFLSLPEETQRKLLKQNTSEKAFHQALERLQETE